MITIPEKIIVLFKQYPNVILSQPFIYKQCWGAEWDPTCRATLQSNMYYVRKQLPITVARGRGYKYEEG